MFRFEGLEIWKDSIEYADKCYDVSKTFPKEETFSLADQLRRAAVSIPNNIAEGSAGTDKDFANFLNIALKSAMETVSILIFAERRGYIRKGIRVGLYGQAETLIRRVRAFKNTLK